MVKLTCKSCGAKLELTDDIDRFSCSHCGTEWIVNRSGGIVSLKEVEDGIRELVKEVKSAKTYEGILNEEELRDKAKEEIERRKEEERIAAAIEMERIISVKLEKENKAANILSIFILLIMILFLLIFISWNFIKYENSLPSGFVIGIIAISSILYFSWQRIKKFFSNTDKTKESNINNARVKPSIESDEKTFDIEEI